jgi:hypothetical protein
MYTSDLLNLLVDFVYHQEYEILHEILHEIEYHGMDGEIKQIEIMDDGIVHQLMMGHIV